jgi:hypothetical protein
LQGQFKGVKQVIGPGMLVLFHPFGCIEKSDVFAEESVTIPDVFSLLPCWCESFFESGCLQKYYALVATLSLSINLFEWSNRSGVSHLIACRGYQKVGSMGVNNTTPGSVSCQHSNDV